MFPMSYTYLPDRTVFRLQGPDTDELLQGIITQDVTKVRVDAPKFAAMLNAQGKLLYDFFLIRIDDNTLLLDCDARHSDALFKKLKMYKLRADVRIEDQSDAWQVHAGWNNPPPNAWPESAIIFTDPRLDTLGWRALTPSDVARASDDAPATTNDYAAHRIACGVPTAADDATERMVVLDLGYDALHAVDFAKGCYVGQEVTARMHYRHVRRKAIFHIESQQPLPAQGTEILAGTSKIGELCSTNGTNGLALLRVEELEKAQAAQTPLSANGIALTATLPAWFTETLAHIRAQAAKAQ
ncbi:MAG: folate-binding protein YgfZ [Rickettsiales bacterium]|nr:folate-binding protein YgfZ [Rickettsiales bacterium]